jgi:hypothetical protein
MVKTIGYECEIKRIVFESKILGVLSAPGERMQVFLVHSMIEA